jgi:hypothetical protein
MRTNPLGVPSPDSVRGGVVLDAATQQHPVIWHCANRHCEAAARTVDSKIPYHRCPEMNGVMIPLVRDEQRGQVGHRLIERPDDVRSDAVQPITDKQGRLIMAVQTERSDGYDTTVFVPTATATADEIREATAHGRHEG